MATSETGTSTSNPFGGEYQVFLSFRGPDTRRGFADTLYHALSEAGIHVFIDNEEIRPGERIDGELLRAINDSRLYIPIFSPNYASSYWCLCELAKMVENISNSGEDETKKAILPIFYNVKPDDVKLRTPSYENDIQNLEQMMKDKKKNFSSEDANTWRRALKTVGGISGLELKNYTGDGHLSKSVVDEVVNRLRTRQREVTEDLVGMENRISAINNLLDIDVGDVRLIGIYGMCGMGKTTLAKEIYNQLCPHFKKSCSFLRDVRETAKTVGLVKLQEQLLSDISNSTVAHNIRYDDDGIKAIEGTICNKKVLVVLDDVDDGNQIRKLIGRTSLYPGTRILVTTRDSGVLNIRGLKYKFKPYELEGLSDEHALQLFSKHAFDVDSPPEGYDTLSKDIIHTAGGQPLALQAIGASLFGQKNKKIWEEMLWKLEKTLNKDVMEQLKISYDALETDQKQIFLDIACFFIGWKKTEPIFVWDDCGFSSEHAIDVLTKRCMIKVLDDNEFWMCDQFRDLGRAIAKKEGTRLWDTADIIRELSLIEKKQNVQALCFHSQCRVDDPCITVTAKEIKRFSHLQFLWLHGVRLQGDFVSCLSKLKWFYLSHYTNGNDDPAFMPTNLHLEDVVVLDTYGYEWTEDAIKSLIKEATKLKVLSIDSCRLTHETPIFSKHLVLEKLSFIYCYSLKKISCSIGKLRWLTYLEFVHCKALEKLPEQIGGLKNLQHLSFVDCQSLRGLPDSVGKLKNLQHLSFRFCPSLRGLPDSVSKLDSLTELDLDDSKFDLFTELDLDDCNKIQELPELPKSLATLRLASRSLQSIPDVSKLTNLVELLLSDGYSNITKPCDLSWIGRLFKLRKFELCLLNVPPTSIEWGSLSLLEELRLDRLDLQTLKQLPSSLRVLKLEVTQVKQVELDGLPNLEGLIIGGCEHVARISITSSLNKLRDVEVFSCPKLVELQFHGVLKSMESLYISNNESLERLVCLSEEELGCNELQAPELTGGRRRVSLVSSSLKMLRKLNLLHCPGPQEIQFVSMLEALKFFSVSGCSSLKRLGGLSNLKNLNSLSIWSCPTLQVVEGIDKLDCLENLGIGDCRSVERIFESSSSKIPKECRIEIDDCGQLLNSGRGESSITWECYREMILNARTPASYSAIEKTFSETGDPLLEQMANMEEKRQVASMGKYVGTDDQVNDIMSLMNIDAKDKRMVVVIHGEAGIGKTTLAKLIYNQVSWDFDGCSFLTDITETTQELGGLQLLQTKLISDVLNQELEDVAFVSREIEFFRDSFCNMRVLIILDDVENAFHVEKLIGDGFDCFASGSRILVTTRNNAVLEESPQIWAYHVRPLDKEQALQLLRQHASIPTSLEILNSTLNAMAGLPLFIEVMGAVLNGTPQERWSQLSMEPMCRQQNFRPFLEKVYQTLDYKQKQIFLDIACFTTGIHSQIAWYLWDDSSFLPSRDILTPLAKIGENNQIWMHSILRQFGREIVSGENHTDPGSRSRLVNHEIALDTIRRKKGTEKVEALCLNFHGHTSDKLIPEDLESMPNLRFLQLDHADIAGDFTKPFPKLRWLRWRGCPRHLQITNFQLGNLTILDLSWSKVTKNWEGWDQIEMKNLRVLDLTGCVDLLVTPKFSGCQNLAILILEQCSQLVKIDHSIGDLKCLVSLNLKLCAELSMLPVEVGRLTTLQELLMDGTSVQEIPISIGHLKQLKVLSASNCFSLSQLPRTICHLTNISLISLDGTRIAALPDSIGQLVRLKHLSLRDCRQIRKLPNSIGNIGRSLIELDVSGTGISKFPDSLKNLQNLKVLRMDSSFFTEFPPAIKELTVLEELHASWCPSLEGGLPSEIGKLHNLRILRLQHSAISSIPLEIHQLSNLRTLDLLYCDMVKELPRLPSSITFLTVDEKLKTTHLP